MCSIIIFLSTRRKNMKIWICRYIYLWIGSAGRVWLGASQSREALLANTPLAPSSQATSQPADFHVCLLLLLQPACSDHTTCEPIERPLCMSAREPAFVGYIDILTRRSTTSGDTMAYMLMLCVCARRRSCPAGDYLCTDPRLHG